MLTHQGTRTLITKRLILRPFREEDAADMYCNWASDKNVTRFLDWMPHETLDETRAVLRSWIPHYAQPDFYLWAIVYDGQVIGSINASHLSDRSERAELGYCIGAALWGKGIMAEAVNAVTEYLFGTVGLHRLMICHAEKNPASGRVAQKCGYAYEGTHREHSKRDGAFQDIAVYARLCTE